MQQLILVRKKGNARDIRLYEVTKEPKYLELSKFFIDERGKRPYYFDKEHPEEVKKGHENDLRYFYNQAHLPVRQQDEAVGHAVRAVYLYSGMADIARLTEDETLYSSCEKLWDSMANEKMYITGGIGGTHIGEAFSYPYNLPNDTAYAETCASIGLVFFARRMLEIKPDAKYANVMERALYNGILSGMALDGKSFFYVNPLEVLPEASHKDERKFHVKPVRQKWFGCACCPPNLARLVSSIGSKAYTEKEDTLFVHLYMGSELTKKVGDKDANVAITSELPWDGNVEIAVEAKDTDFVLALRIPDWCGGNYTVDGIEKDEMSEKDGYLYVKKGWSEKDVLKLHFSMPLLLMEADEKVREDAGKVAVLRGPIVYCLEEVDNGKNLHLLEVNPDGKYEIKDGEICGNPVKIVEMDGFRVVDTAKKDGELYHVYKRKEKEAAELKFVPYYTWANRGENEMMVWVRI